MPITLSDQTIDALAEIISGGSASVSKPPIGLYRQGWKIEAWFKLFGVPVDVGKESRVPATKSALQYATFVDNDDLMKRIIERAADPRDFIAEPEKHTAVLEYLNRHLQFDDLRLDVVGSKSTLRTIPQADEFSPQAELIAMSAGIDFDTASRDIERAIIASDTDPEIAVTAACATIESVCRSILVELDIPLPTKQDISGLYKALREPLGISPDKEDVSSEIVNDVRAILSGLSTVVQGVGSLRTHAGGAHGKERGFRRIDRRIARLAIYAASSLSLFLIETWQLRYPNRKLRFHPAQKAPAN